MVADTPRKTRRDGSERRPRVLVVTPAFDAERYIDEAVMSVISQASAGARLFYHVQDGGSRDGTLDRLSAWAERIDRGHVPHFASELRFSFASAPDGGMYQAVNRGFRRLRPRADDILTWINTDDRLAPGAVAAVVQVFRDVPECRFLSGRVSLLNGEGAMMTLDPPRPWARETIAAGLHDGRSMPFIMQEGTFFSGRLWNTVGGADESFRLAGDWDLWRRMAAAAEHFTVDAITGYHRRRPGQLSEDMAAYYREIDRRRETLPPPPSEAPGISNLVRFDSQQGRWLHHAFTSSDADLPTVFVGGVEARACACAAGVGFGPAEGPYPEHNLPYGMRWAMADAATVTVTAPADGRYRVRFTLRPTQAGSWLGIAIEGRAPLPFLLADPRPGVNQVVEFPTWLMAGANAFAFDIRSYNGTDPRLLLIASEAIMMDLAPAPALLGGESERLSAAVVIAATDDPDRLESSLVSALSAVAGRVRVIVATDADPLCRLLLDRFAHVVTVVSHGDSTADDLDRTIMSDARAEGAPYLIHLAAGNTLVPGAVETAMRIAETLDADEVAGLIALRSPRGDLLRLGMQGADRAGVLRRLTSSHGGPPRRIEVAFAMVARVAADRASESGPLVWLLEEDSADAGGSMALLAAALTLLGVDARLTRVTASPTLLFDTMGGEILCSETVHRAEWGAVVLEERPDALLLDGGSSETRVSLPRCVDTVRLVPRDRARARDRLGLPRDALLVVIAEETTEATRDRVGRIARSAGGLDIHVVNLGVPLDRWRGRLPLTQPGWSIDPVLLSFYVSACDLALVPSGQSTRLALTAWACGVTVVDGARALRPDGSNTRIGVDLKATLRAVGLSARGVDDGSSRDLVEARHSIEALALAVRAARPMLSRLPQLAAWLERCDALQSGDVRVQSVPAQGLSPERFRGQSDGVLVPLTGCRSDESADGPLTIRSAAASALLVLGEVHGATLHLTVRGVAGQAWTFALNGGEPSEPREAGPDALSMTLAAPIGPGVHRLDVALRSPSSPGEVRLRLDEWRVTGPATPERARSTHAHVLPLSIGRERYSLAHDGDWLRQSGFSALEPAFPAAGFHAPLRWSLGTRCATVVRTQRGGARRLQLVLSGIIPDQRIRPIVAGVAHDWSAPLDGTPGRIAYRSWILDMAKGDVAIEWELSSSQRVADGRDLGIILLGLELALPDPAAVALSGAILSPERRRLEPVNECG